MNQGHDVIEFINGNTALKPADEPILEAKFARLPGKRSVEDWLAIFHDTIEIFRDLSPLQMRELMLDSDARAFRKGDIVFERNAPGSSLFAIAQGSVAVEVAKDDPSITVPIGEGSIFGEVGSSPGGGAAPRCARRRRRSWSSSRAMPRSS